MPPRRTIAGFLMIVTFAARAGAQIDPPETGEKPRDGKDVVAIAGERIVLRRDVEIAWSSAYERVEDLMRQNKIRPAQRARRLQKEWTDAIRRVIQQELIFQEATRERRRLIDRIVRMRVTGGDSAVMTRRDVNRLVRREEERFFGAYRTQVVADAGGWKEIQKLLDRQGASRAEWETKLREQFIVRRFLAMKVGEARVSPRAVREYYRKNLDRFSRPEEVKFREILVARDEFRKEAFFRKAAEAISGALASGRGDFEAIAKKVSHAPSKRRDGLYVIGGRDFVERGVHEAAVEAAIDKLEPGQVSGPIETERGIYFIRLEKRRPAGPRPLGEVQDAVVRGIRTEAIGRKRLELFEKLRKDGRVQIQNDRLPEKFQRDPNQEIPDAEAGTAG